MKLFLFSILLLFAFNVQAQEMLSYFFELPKVEVIDDEIDTIITYEYELMAYEEEGEADTMIVIAEDTLNFMLKAKTVTIASSPVSNTIEKYDANGSMLYSRKIVLDDAGRIIEDVSQSDNAYSYFNSEKYYEYDGDKLVKAYETNGNALVLKYDENDFPLQMIGDQKLGKLIFKREDTENGYRYNGELELSDEFKALLGDKVAENGEKNYIIYEPINESHKFTYYKEMNGEINQEEYYIRDKDGKLIEFDQSWKNQKYSYDDLGRLIKIEDLKSGDVWENVYDEHGNPTVLYEQDLRHEIKYDARNSMLQRMSYDMDGRLVSFELYTNKYKK